MKLIWDWNGTLLDDLALGLHIINTMLEERALPLLSLERYRQIMGFPIIDYYRKAGLGDLTEETYQPLANRYMDMYRENWRGCPLHEGVREMLADPGYEHSLLTASWTKDVTEQLAFYGLEKAFSVITSADDHFARGKAEQGQRHLQALRAQPGEVLMIGDTVHDAQVAGVMGCPCVLMAYGHQSRSRLEATGFSVAEDMQTLKRLLEEQSWKS